jgi:hypothetical protein
MSEKQSINDHLNQTPILEFEGFVIRPLDGWHLFMENPSGEGTSIRRDVFLGTLCKLFEDNF